MAARKKTTRRKATAKKSTRKKAARKTTTRRRKAPSLSARRDAAMKRLEKELPTTLKEFSQNTRRNLNRLERQIASSQRGVRRRWTRLLRDASHSLGKIEAEGQKRWRQQSTKARKDTAALLRRLEKAVEPPKPKRRARRA